MRIAGGGSQDINTLFSDAAQFRNQDFVVNNDQAFMGRMTQVAVAAEYSHIQVWNPLASGVTVLLDGFIVSTDTAQRIFVGEHAVQLVGTTVNWINLKIALATGQAEIIRDTNAVALGSYFAAADIGADLVWTHRFDFAPQLAEEEGIVIVPETVNTLLTVTYWGREL